MELTFTRYEMARIIGARALQIAMDAPLLLKLSEDELKKVEELKKKGIAERQAARQARSSTKGLIMIYPISKNSKPIKESGVRCALYNDSNDPLAKDLIGIAISFPKSNQYQPVEAYLTGTLAWRPVE